jgi:hypothetical protein
MDSEPFFRRWSRLKNQSHAKVTAPTEPQVQHTTSGEPPGDASVAAKAEQALPTLDDVARLTADSDYSGFVVPGVNKDVQRLALKKLFSDPRINAMDRLDIYIDDYTKPDPISAAMLASLRHAHSVLGWPDEADADADQVSQDQTQTEVERNSLVPGEPFFPSNSAEHPPPTIAIHNEEAAPPSDQAASKGTV